ncbi:MAG: HAD-IA family hydrolase [Bacteroidota bacterium]
MLKNIIFDFGNVLIDLELEQTTIELSKFIFQKLAPAQRQHLHETLFDVYEVGKMTEQDFLDALRYHADVPATQQEMIDAWNAMLIGIPVHRFDFLRSLGDYRLFLLSNTNETHLKWVDQHLRSVHAINMQDFNQYFEKAYYSHLIHLRKPNAAIYEFVLQDANLKAAETLFIDDNAANIAAAKALGFQTIHLGIKEEVTEAFTNYLHHN